MSAPDTSDVITKKQNSGMTFSWRTESVVEHKKRRRNKPGRGCADFPRGSRAFFANYELANKNKKEKLKSANASPFNGGRRALLLRGLSNPQKALHWYAHGYHEGGCKRRNIKKIKKNSNDIKVVGGPMHRLFLHLARKIWRLSAKKPKNR